MKIIHGHHINTAIEDSKTKAANSGPIAKFYKHRVSFASIAICLISITINLYRLGSPSIWMDEAYSVEVAQMPISSILHFFSVHESNMVFYYLILHWWIKIGSLFGIHPTEFFVRFPSAIFASLCSLVIFLMGKKLWNFTTGLIASSLFFLNNLQLVYAQQTRGYSLVLLFVCISWYALFLITRDTKQRKLWWACFAVVTSLAIYTQGFSLINLASQVMILCIWWFLSDKKKILLKKVLPGLLVSFFAIGLVCLPFFLKVKQGAGISDWLPQPHLSDIYHLFLTISAESKVYLLLITLVCFLAFVSASKGNLGKLGIKKSGLITQSQPGFIWLTCWLLIPTILSYIVSQGTTHIFSSRYLTIIIPALCLLTGFGISAIANNILKVALAVVFLLLSIHHLPQYYATAQVENWRTSIQWVEQHYSSGDGMVCYDNVQGCQIAAEYYLDLYGGPAHFEADYPGAYSWSTFGPANPGSDFSEAVDPNALQSYGSHHQRLIMILGRLSDVTQRQANTTVLWLDNHYQLVNKYTSDTVTVLIYKTQS